MKKDTQLIEVGRDKKWTGNAVNPRIVRASTLTFDSMAELREKGPHKTEKVDYYGRRGTATTFALREAIAELDNAADCYIYPCGAAAISGALMSFLGNGDHLLMVDSVYEPTRDFCADTLARYGAETTYYDPLIGADIAQLVQANTKVIFLESPGSMTMEVQDVPAIVAVAKQHDIVTMIDNTYATPLNFKPLDFGVDIAIQSASKYLNGHSDAMLGVASANEKHWPTLQRGSFQLGYCASADDIYTALRGVRTLGVRLKQHAENALRVASWLDARDEVDHVRHPAFAACPGHEFYQRDFSGGNGLFSFVLKPVGRKSLDAMVDNMRLFKIGFSWGGYESLILPANSFAHCRTATGWDAQGPTVRLHIGLEDVDDLIDDLRAGFSRLQA